MQDIQDRSLESYLLEPVELTDIELEAVAGGNAVAAAASGDNFAAALAVAGFHLTLGGLDVSADHAALAIAA